MSIKLKTANNAVGGLVFFLSKSSDAVEWSCFVF